MKEDRREYWFKILILSTLGFVGVLSALPLIPKLMLISGQEAPLPMPVLYVVSTFQSSVFVVAMVFLGAWVSPKVNLGTPLIDAYINKSLNKINYKKVFLPATIGGVAGGVLLVLFYSFFLAYLPSEFIENGKEFNPPAYTRLLYGGITEEILIRYGLMSFFALGIFRITQKKDSSVRAYNYIFAILVSSLIFAAGHLPVASLLSPVVTDYLVVYIILGNSILGLIAGFLYWRRGLEAAIIAHMVAHIVMIVVDKFT